MERVDQKWRGGTQGVRDTYKEGLRSMFPACEDPVPAKMEGLIQRLSAISEVVGQGDEESDRDARRMRG